MQQVGAPQIRPQCRWDRVPQQPRIRVQLRHASGSRKDRGYCRMGERKLKRRRNERHPVAVANGSNAGYPSNDIRRVRVYSSRCRARPGCRC